MPTSTPPHPLICYVASLTGVPPTALVGPSKRREYFYGRAIACFLLMRMGYHLSAIGRLLDRHHSSVINAIAYVEAHPAVKERAEEYWRILEEMSSAAMATRLA